MKPVIGFTTQLVEAYQIGKDRVRGMPDQDMMVSPRDYCLAVYKAGGIPVGIPLIDDDEYLISMVSKIDGLLLPGGGDVNPFLYGQPLMPGIGNLEPLRDKVEIKLIELCIEKNIPILGVCRGFQLLNVYFKGTLIQDIYKYYNIAIDHRGGVGPKWTPIHNVSLSEVCDFYRIYGKSTIQVNSVHHQIIDKLGDGLMACGYSEDGIVEAFYHKENTKIFGIQWHPEMMMEVYPQALKPYELLIDYASERGRIGKNDRDS